MAAAPHTYFDTVKYRRAKVRIQERLSGGRPEDAGPLGPCAAWRPRRGLEAAIARRAEQNLRGQAGRPSNRRSLADLKRAAMPLAGMCRPAVAAAWDEAAAGG